jgi:hypothetical protein
MAKERRTAASTRSGWRLGMRENQRVGLTDLPPGQVCRRDSYLDEEVDISVTTSRRDCFSFDGA